MILAYRPSLGMLLGSGLGQRIGVVTTMNLAAALITASAGAALFLPPRPFPAPVIGSDQTPA